MYYTEKFLGRTSGAFDFKPFVAPKEFKSPTQYLDYGLKVDCYSIFKQKYALNNALTCVYEFDELNQTAINIGTSKAYQTIDGVEYEMTGSFIFTAGSTKRYVCLYGTTNINLRIGAIWVYCGNVLSIDAYSNAKLNYIFYSDLSKMTTIGDSAFQNCTGFTGSLTIPNSVSSIGNSAFYGCSGFTGSLTIPNSVTTIGTYAFQNCTGFTGSLTIPNSVSSIGNYAFQNCTGFTGALTIPNSVTTIGTYAFYGCSGFTGALTIGNSVSTIGTYAFYGCSGFTGSLTIPNSVTTIGDSAFQNCTGFTGSLTIPNSVSSIGTSAFYGCTGFTGSLTIPNSVSSIGTSAFYGCSGFTGLLTIPNSVSTIAHGVFSICSFNEVLIPNSVINILGANTLGAFAFNTQMTSIDVGNGITYIGMDFVRRNTSLRIFICRAIVPPELTSASFSELPLLCKIYVPDSAINEYKDNALYQYWNAKKTQIYKLSDI